MDEEGLKVAELEMVGEPEGVAVTEKSGVTDRVSERDVVVE